MTDGELIGHIETLYFGIIINVGHITSTALYYLSKNSISQDKLVAEVSELRDDDASDWKSINKLPYLDAVLRETLRMAPITRIERRAVVDTELGGIPIPRGTLIIVPAYSIHHDSRYFEDPHSFKPERFLEPSRGGNNLKAFMPFGGGPRVCPGKRVFETYVKFALVAIMRRFKFEWSAITKVCNAGNFIAKLSVEFSS